MNECRAEVGGDREPDKLSRDRSVDVRNCWPRCLLINGEKDPTRSCNGSRFGCFAKSNVQNPQLTKCEAL